MKMKSVILLVVAVGCGLVAMLGVQQVLTGQKSEETQMGQVLVAIAEIPPSNPLDEKNTAFKEMPLDTIPEGAVTDPAEIVEKTLKSTAVPGEFIMLAKLGTDKGASYDIPKGMRVVTTSVNLTKTHSGLIRPGDRVDILLSYRARNPERGMVNRTKTILEFIEVFATDSIIVSHDQSEASEINAKNLSFLVTPEQAAILKLAESKGDLNLALRHKLDDEHVDIATIGDDYLDDKDGSSIGAVNEEEEGERGPMLADVEEGGDTRAALAAEIAEPKEAEPEVAEVPTWKVTIYAGEDVLEQDVPLPLDENGMTEEEAALAEREARLAEREAVLNAREAEMNKQSQPVDGPAGDASKQPSAAKEDKEGSVLQGVKKLLIGA